MCAEERRSAAKIQVRPGVCADVSAILEILAEAPEAAGWSAAAVEEALNCHGRLFLVADVGSELVGFAVARIVTDEGEILNFAVKKAYRGRGLGRLLLEKLLQKLREQDATKVFLEVRESNATAIAFYGKLGFRDVGRRGAYYQQPDEAAVIMQAELRRNLPACSSDPHLP